jgi:3-polyprenyl-4-hydroxybenzoate decarboxylase
MGMAAEAGAVIFPPVPAFYAKPQSIEDLIDNLIGRLLARLGIENDRFMRWRGIGQ